MTRPDSRRALPVRSASRPEDAEVVRRLRNAGRSWFGDEHEVSADEQQRWWTANASRPWFACVLVGDPPIGYGMLQLRADGRRWVSLAVDPADRGRGAGTEIYRVLLEMAGAGESLYAGIRRDNAPSLAAARRAGYVVDDEVQVPAAWVATADPDSWVVLRGDAARVRRWVDGGYPVELARRAESMAVHPERLLPHEGPAICTCCGCEPGEQHDLASHDAASDVLLPTT